MWFFRKNAKDSQKTSVVPNSGDQNDQVPLGIQAHSQSGQYMLITADCAQDESTFTVGYRKRGEGQYYLYERHAQVCSGSLQRPNDGNVANNGNFVLCDWLWGDNPKGVFCAFSKNGEKLIEHRFMANLGKTAISEDGCFGLCETFEADNDDSNCLILFDLRNRTLIWKRMLPYARPNAYVIDPSVQCVRLIFSNVGHIEISFDGEYINMREWFKTVFSTGKDIIVVNSAENVKTFLGEEQMGGLNELIVSALDRVIAGSFAGAERFTEGKYKAIASRLKGEFLCNCGQYQQAITAFEIALTYDPKIPVKRRIAAAKDKMNKFMNQ